MKTYKFKPEFEKKLKGVKRQFMNNIYNEEGENFESYCEIINKHWDNFGRFIRSAFIFSETPEGDDFWHEIAKR